MLTSTVLIIAPIFFALLIMNSAIKFRNILSIVFVAILALFSLENTLFPSSSFEAVIPHFFHNVFIFIDALLLLYFLIQGLFSKNHLVIATGWKNMSAVFD